MTKIIIGLGNPGKKYEMSRHNLGFWVIDKIAENFKFPVMNHQSKFKAEISEGIVSGKKILLVKPQTFMNESGRAVSAISRFYKIKPRDIWVVYDDFDLLLGKLRISFNRSSGGHKGVESIIDQLGRKDFFRFRIGINQKSKIKSTPSRVIGGQKSQTIPIPTKLPARLAMRSIAGRQFKIQNLNKFVLGKFSNEEEKIIQEAIKKTVLAIETALKENIEKAMSKFN